ncbi:MAG TPA: hypothetical protein PLZ08_09015 [Bacillota bacterium]|nr:hypothetical protein [Bacillota bacterium]HPO98077.1 hypothetical protein [Bacillota bacterium]
MKKQLAEVGVGGNFEKFINNLRSVQESIRKIEEKVGTEIKNGNEVKTINSNNINSVSFKSDRKGIGG